jgi:glycosyltransferase involved in cell wall biosynthesis
MSLSSASLTGPAERVLGDARVLLDSGHSAVLACDGVRPGDLRQRAAAARVPCATGLALCQKPTPRQVLADRRRLRAMAREEAYDLFHCHFSHDHHLAMLGLSGARDKVRLVRAVENEANFRTTWSRRWVYRRTDGFEVASDARARRLADEFGISRERIAVLRGAVDAVRFSPVDNAARGENRLRRALGVSEETVLVGIVARMKPERLHSTLIAAFSRLAPAQPAARLVLLGRGEGEGVLRAQVATLGLERAISFAGYWSGEELVEAYRGLDVAVWLAEGNDGSCRGVLEAMACGLPVVVGRGCAAEELLLAGKSGLLIAPDDPAEVADALARLVGSREQREAFGTAGRREVLAHHTWTRRGPALLEFYQRIRQLPSVVFPRPVLARAPVRR